MGVYDDINQSINDELDKDSFFGNIKPMEECPEMDKVKKSNAGKKLKQELSESGKYGSKEELEEAFEMILLQEAKKAKKKAKKKSKAKDEDDDDGKGDKKDDKKSKDVSADDDIDVDTDTDDGDSDDDEKESDSDDKKSSGKDKKSKKSKSKDKDDSVDDTSVEDKADDKDSGDDDKDSKKKDKKSKSKKKDKDEDDSGDDDDIKIEHFNFYSSNYREKIPTIKLVAEEFEAIYMKQYEPKMEIPKKRGYLEATKLRLRPGFEYPAKSPEFEKVVKEFFDISDHNTRKIMVSVDEEDQTMVVNTLTDKLYDIIVSKGNTIDYGPIPDTKGDFEAMPNYGKLRECLEVLKGILNENKQDTAPVDEIDLAIDNLIERKDMFKKSYMSNVQFGIFTYQTMALACVASTSLMISGAVEFIKNPESGTFQAGIDKSGYIKAKNHILFDNLKRFNMICKDKSFDRTLDMVIRESGHNFIGTTHLAGFAAVTLGAIILFNILPILRECTYFFYYTRTRISDWFNIQADLLDISVNNIRNGAPVQGDRNAVIRRQEALRDRFRKIADVFMVDCRQAENKAEVDVRQDAQKMKADEVLNDVPDSTKSSLF